MSTGESTRLNYTKISDEEIERVVPVIEKIKADFDMHISIDTYKSKASRSGCRSRRGPCK